MNIPLWKHCFKKKPRGLGLRLCPLCFQVVVLGSLGSQEAIYCSLSVSVCLHKAQNNSVLHRPLSSYQFYGMIQGHSLESQNHWGWEGFLDVSSPTCCSKQDWLWRQTGLRRMLSSWVLKTFKDIDCATSLHISCALLYCCAFFPTLTSSKNLSCFNLWQLSIVL